MTTPEALLDSNVVIASLWLGHPHHNASVRLFEPDASVRIVISSHSYAEAFSILTRRSGPVSIGLSPAAAWTALEGVASRSRLIGLSAAQTFATIRAYAETGGIGPRLYDRLIGEAAVLHGIPLIVTWNVGHMRGLFPALEVLTPADVIARAA